jgi:5'-AMP-activated protein kinase catalytic alpha subunit
MSLDRKIKKSNMFYELSENFDYINSNSFERNINYSKNEISQYQIKGKIGEGMFGKVKLGIHLLTNEKVAIKIFDKGKIKNEKEVEYIEREISILKKLSHYNTIKLYNIIQNENFIFLIQEYVPNGELLHFLENPENMNLTENHICKIYQQIISGIEYLHDIGIAHRDLKLENILLNRDKNIKIIDFGLSNKYNKENGELLQSSCGSPCYAAPEMIKGIQYHGLDTDIWSSGILLYLMLCKSFPFNDKNNSKLYQKILSGKFNLPNYLSNEAKDLLSKLLKVNPIERIKLDEIKKHPWFNLYNPKNNYFYGIDINKIIMPIDEEIIIDMINIGIEPNIVIDNIIRNCNNNITTIYYLLLQKKIKKGKKSIADFCSNFYMDYINDEKNKFIYFNNDIDLVIQSRIKNINKICKNIRQIKLMNSENGINKPLNNKNKNLKNNYFFIKINPKILKTKNENCNNRQTTERQNLKNILLNFPTKSHTIDHMSKSNSKRKKILKSPNLTRFNTRKYLKNIQNNINTIENKRQINMIYNNRVKPNFKIKKNDCLYSRLLNKRKINDTSGNKNGNSNNFRMLIYNKSVDNKYSKEKYKGINNYMNYNFWKINNIREIRKKIYRTIEIKNRIDSQNSYSPMITHNNEQKYQDNSLLIKSIYGYGNISKNGTNKNIIKLKKKKDEKMNISNINRSKMNNSNQNYYIINKNKNNIKRKSKNSYGINNNRINNLKLKNNNKLLSLSQQKDKKEKKTKVKKASSFSIDLNFKNNQKIEYNIYTNRPKRKNVMKFVNKNNMNLKLGNLYNKYDYYYRNENKKNMNNKSLDLQN